MSVFDLLSSSEGAYLHHLLVLLCAEVMLSAAAVRREARDGAGQGRILLGTLTVLLLRCLLLVGESLGPPVIGPLLSCVGLVSITVLGWIALDPAREDPLSSGFLLVPVFLSLMAVGVLLPWWYFVLVRNPGSSYSGNWQQIIWCGLTAMQSLATLIALRAGKRATFVPLARHGFRLLFVGSSVCLSGAVLLTGGWIDAGASTALRGVGRLAEVAAFAAVAVALHRVALADMRGQRAALRIANAALIEEQDDLRFALDAGSTIVAALDTETVLGRALGAACNGLGADRAAIAAVCDAEMETFRILARSRGADACEPSLSSTPLPLANYPALHYAIQRRRQLTLGPVRDNPRLEALCQLLGADEPAPVLLQPLASDGAITGALILGNDRTQRTFSPEQLQLSLGIAPSIATALNNAAFCERLWFQSQKTCEEPSTHGRVRQVPASLLDCASEGIIGADDNGRIRTVNVAARTMLARVQEQSRPWKSETGRQDPAAGKTVLGEASYGKTSVLQKLFALEREETKPQEQRRETSLPSGAPTDHSRFDSGDALTELQTRFLESVRRGALGLVSMAENLRCLDEVAKGTLDLRYSSVNLPCLAQAVFQAFSGQITAKRLDLRLELAEELPRVEVDPVRLRQILDNLVSNAIMYTPSGESIRFRAKLLGDARDNAGEFSIEVTNTGAGFHTGSQASILANLGRAIDNHDTDGGGLGIGLYIVRKLVEAHKGHVTVESMPEGPTTVAVVLPVARPTDDD